MRKVDAWKQVGIVLRRLIQEHYSTQEEFALDFWQDLRVVNRWINQGINKIDKAQELADFFQVDFLDFFKVIVRGADDECRHHNSAKRY